MRVHLGVILLTLYSATCAQPKYEYVTLGGDMSPQLSMVGVNNQGVAAGSLFLGYNNTRACLVEVTKVTLLPLFEGKFPWHAIAINDRGDVLGAGTFGHPYYRSVLYRAGRVIDLGMPAPYYTGTPSATALNSRGQVIGYLGSALVIWENGVLRRITRDFYGTALNDQGQIAGSRNGRAAMWDGGIHILHPYWAETSVAVDINRHGHIAGHAHIPNVARRGLLWTQARPIDLGHLGWSSTRPYGMNDNDDIVGTSQDIDLSIKGVLWQDGNLYRLIDLVAPGHGQSMWLGKDINNHGQILANGSDIGMNQARWYLLNPLK